MIQNDLYDTRLTKDAFKGTYYSFFARKICSNDEKILGSIRGKKIKDLNNKTIAKFDSKVDVDVDGEQKQSASIFKAVEGDDVFRVEGKEVFLNNEKIGGVRVIFATIEEFFIASVVCLGVAILSLIIALATTPFRIKPIIDIRDENGNWGAQKNLVVFDKTLYPGVEGDYSFIIRNSQDLTLEYSIEFQKTETNVDIDCFPLEFQLKMNNQVIGGSEWSSIENLRFSEMLIMPNSDQAFTLGWRWSFDGNNDDGDTKFAIENGNISIAINISAKVK